MKRSSLEIKKEILKVLSDNQPHSYADLERKVNTNWETIRNNCEELEFFKCVFIENKKILITEYGKKFKIFLSLLSLHNIIYLRNNVKIINITFVKNL